MYHVTSVTHRDARMYLLISEEEYVAMLEDYLIIIYMFFDKKYYI